MTDYLTPENKALVERVLGYGTARTYNRHEIDRIIDAARAEGRRSPGDTGFEGLPGSVPFDHCADAGPCPHSPDMLTWLAEHRSLELDYGFDAEAEDMFWRVHKISGSINDREWDLIGQGATPLAALLSAKSYLEAKSAELTA